MTNRKKRLNGSIPKAKVTEGMLVAKTTLPLNESRPATEPSEAPRHAIYAFFDSSFMMRDKRKLATRTATDKNAKTTFY